MVAMEALKHTVMGSSKRHPLVLPLRQYSLKDLPTIGGKNASLGEMLQELEGRNKRDLQIMRRSIFYFSGVNEFFHIDATNAFILRKPSLKSAKETRTNSSKPGTGHVA